MSKVVRERPILFSASMVRAILDSRKTVTRRVVKGTALEWLAEGLFDSSYVADPGNGLCPYGQVGDRLWVRETHAIFSAYGQNREDGTRWGPWAGLPTVVSPDGTQIAYFREGFDRCDPGRWRPSIHMPRWASRIILEVTAVRVERLQDITAEQVIAEGIDRVEDNFGNGPAYCDYSLGRLDDTAEWFSQPIPSFRSLWESINGAGSWADNPWVWCIEFRRVEVPHAG